MPANREVQLLLVDDDPLDVMAVRRALQKAKIANPLHVAQNGLEALEMLEAMDDDGGDSADDPTRLRRPYLILLDLNMPRMNGLEFLQRIRNSEKLSDSIIFVLTTSDDDRDITKAYENFVAGYLVKSRVGHDFVELIGLLDHYWRVVEFP